MNKNRIFKNQTPKRPVFDSPINQEISKHLGASIVKSNIHYSIIQNIELKDYVEKQTRQSITGEVIRLAYISEKNQLQIDQNALYALQKHSSTEIAFVGIYGQRGSGKSFLFDKILNLAQVQGSHYCRTTKQYQKGLYFYTSPFIKTSELKVFLLDCVGFDPTTNRDQNDNTDQILLDLMLILGSSVIILPSPQDLQGKTFKTVYNKICQSMKRITEKKQQTTLQKQYWPKNIYCLCRGKQSINPDEQVFQQLFLNYNYTVVHDAMTPSLRSMGLNNSDLIDIQSIPQSNTNSLQLNGIYIKQISRVFRQIMQAIYSKMYMGLKFNGNVCCKLILTLVQAMNNKQKLRIDKIFLSILKELYDSAFKHHAEYYDQKLQEYFTQEDAYPMDYLLEAFKNCRDMTLAGFDQLNINKQMNQQYQAMLENYIEEKQLLVLDVNKKKTKLKLNNKLKSYLNLNKKVVNTDHIFNLLQGIKNTEPQLDHNRCQVLSAPLAAYATNLGNIYQTEIQKDNQISNQVIISKIQQKTKILQKFKNSKMKSLLTNTESQNKYKDLFNQNIQLEQKLKNTKKQIQIQKKFQKKFLTSKQASKQHAEQLLILIRQLQQKSKDNQKSIIDINKEFQYHPAIQALNKRIQEKVLLQKEFQKGESQISLNQHLRKSQIRNVSSTIKIPNNNSGQHLPSLMK